MSAAASTAAQQRIATVPAAFRSRGTRSARSSSASSSRRGPAAVAAAPVVRAATTEKKTVIKVCGVTTVEDATQAAAAGATYIGMILWPKSKRSISLELATEVAAAAKAGGAIPVGVFVDEGVEEIKAACAQVGLDHAQLHGEEMDGNKIKTIIWT